jgi:uncharacterized protein (TIGR03067 family)
MFALFMLGAGLATSADNAVLKENNRLEGTWNLVSVAEDGNKPRPRFKSALILTDGRFIVYILPKTESVDNPGTSIESCYRIDPIRAPGSIDITPLSGPDKGKTIRAIYVLKGDHLQICQTTVPNKERPTGLVSKRGTLLQTFKRQ